MPSLYIVQYRCAARSLAPRRGVASKIVVPCGRCVRGPPRWIPAGSSRSHPKEVTDTRFHGTAAATTTAGPGGPGVDGGGGCG